MVFNKIEKKLIYRLVLYTVLISLVTTGVQLLFTLDSGKKEIRSDHGYLFKTNKSSLSLAVWSVDLDQIKTNVIGFFQYKHVLYVAIKEKDTILFEVGEDNVLNSYRSEFPLTFLYKGENRKIGELIIVSGFQNLYDTLWKIMAQSFIIKTIEYSILLFLFVLIFRKIVSFRFRDFSRFLIQDQGHSDQNAIYQYQEFQDELDELFAAYNNATTIRNHSINELEQKKNELTRFKAELEQTVEERTRELSRLNRIVQEAPMSVVLTDNKGRIEYANTQFETSTGYALNEVIGKTQSFLRSNLHDRHFYKELWDTVLAGDVWKGSILNKTKSGHPFWEYISIFPLMDEENQITHFAAFKEDITEQKKTNEMLETRVEELDRSRSTMLKVVEDLREAKFNAEEATKIKSTFLANMSHEVRTPLNSILGMSNLMANTELTSKQDFYLTQIRTASDNLLNILNDILDISKIESGKMSMEKTRFPLENVISSLNSIVSVKAWDKQLDFFVEVSPQVPMELKGDPLRLGQILINLVNNAIKFTEKGEVVLKIECAPDRKGQPLGGKAVLKFTVFDTGIGIPEDQVQSLFDSFSQGDQSTTRKYGGSGLGLTIAKRLVEMMNGEITVKSTVGKGSVFSFTAEFDVKTKVDVIETLFPDSGGRNALLTGKNATATGILMNLLELSNFKVTQVGTKTDLFAELMSEGSDYDLIIMDAFGSEINGLETAEEIQTLHNLPKDPGVLVVVPFSQEVDEEQLFQRLGKNSDYLIQPITPYSFCGAVKKVLSPEEQISNTSKHLQHHIMFQRQSVLVAEDDTINQMVIVETLENLGLEVRVVGDGQQALDAMEQQDFQLVILDVEMPVLNGLETAKKIREKESEERIPVIALTASMLSEDRNSAMEAGIDDYLLKPLENELLIKTLSKYLQESDGESALKKEEVSVQWKEFSFLDWENALYRLGNNAQLYNELLFKFSQERSGAVTEIKRLIAEGRLKEARKNVHTLKGVCGNLGIQTVYERCSVIEEMLKVGHKDKLDQLIEHLEKDMLSVVEALKKVALNIREYENQEAVLPMSSDMQDLLRRLKPYLINGEPLPAKEIIAKINQFQISKNLKEQIKKLEKLITKYRFQEALELLDLIIGNEGEV